MDQGAAVLDADATVHMSVATERVVGLSTVRLLELADRNPRELAPELERAVKIEVFVQIEAHAKTGLVGFELVPKPAEEDTDRVRIAVGEHDLVVTLRALAGVQGERIHESITFRHVTDQLDRLLLTAF